MSTSQAQLDARGKFTMLRNMQGAEAKRLGLKWNEYLVLVNEGKLPKITLTTEEYHARESANNANAVLATPTSQAPVIHRPVTLKSEVNAPDMSKDSRMRSLQIRINKLAANILAIEETTMGDDLKADFIATKRTEMEKLVSEVNALALSPTQFAADGLEDDPAEELAAINNATPHRQAPVEPVQRQHKFTTPMPEYKHVDVVPSTRTVQTDTGAVITHRTRTLKPATTNDFATTETVDQTMDEETQLLAQLEALRARKNAPKQVKLVPLPGTPCGANISYDFDEKTGIVSFHVNTNAPDLHPTKNETSAWVAELDNSLGRLNGVRFSFGAYRKLSK